MTRRPSRSKNSRFDNGARAVGFAVVGIDEDEIDVGGDVELAAAELAHPDHDELLRGAVLVARLAVHRGERRVVQRQRPRRSATSASVVMFGADLVEIGAAGEVAGERVQQHAAAQRAQRGGQRARQSPASAGQSSAAPRVAQANGASSVAREPVARRPGCAASACVA